MLLIFGGTTEGRLAVEVCEQAGKRFFYSTKGELQDVEMHNGVRLTGAMTAPDILRFCHEHEVKAVIDAAHPFASNLHTTIAQCGLPVIRLQRDFGSHIDGVTYCSDFDDAVRRMESDGVRHLLALSGANTISRLKPFWEKCPTVFRILDRKESRDIASHYGLNDEDIIFYDSSLTLPSMEEERDMMQSLHCDALLTKESGESGGFESKVHAALSLGMRVYVVEHPALPTEWTYVTGRHTLRRAIEHMVPDFFPLKTGLTTGACATAATKAAVISLLSDDFPEDVSFALPDGEVLTIPVECTHTGVATVVKDYSDDPDVLRGCKITSMVSWRDDDEIVFHQGEGVGKVTLPGLGIPVGGPAVNQTPRQMITDEIRTLTERGVNVTISVENGRELALKTFNHKVGVVDGISIIGTSGIVHPLSNDAFVRSIRREMEVAKAMGCMEIGLVSGLKSERALMAIRGESSSYDVPKETGTLRCVHYGNFIGDALQIADELGFPGVTIAIMIGKAVKLAEGHMDTHSHKVTMNKTFLKTLASEDCADMIDGITMARELWDVMPQSFFDAIKANCLRHCRTVYPHGELTIQLTPNT